MEDITGARSYREIGKRAVYFRYKKVWKGIIIEFKRRRALRLLKLLTAEQIAEKKPELNHWPNQAQTEKSLSNCIRKITNRKGASAKTKGTERTCKHKQLSIKKDWDIFNPFKGQLELHNKLAEICVNLGQITNVEASKEST